MENVGFFLLTVSKFSAHRSPLASHRSHGNVVEKVYTSTTPHHSSTGRKTVTASQNSIIFCRAPPTAAAPSLCNFKKKRGLEAACQNRGRSPLIRESSTPHLSNSLGFTMNNVMALSSHLQTSFLIVKLSSYFKA